MNSTALDDRPLLDVDDLRGRVAGEVYGPEDAGWDAARSAWNLAADQRPALVVLAESAADVAETVRFAAERGLRVAAQGTGHAASALRWNESAILLRTSSMRGVEIDPVRRRARAEAGALWMDVTVPAAEHGLAALSGSSPDVGVVGYTLGGGMSWLGRRYGLAANSVTAVEVVTADGELVRADAGEHPDLFWALRGGGGSFAIVTAIEFALHPLHEVYAGALFWPMERAGEILAAWRRWTETVPDAMTSVGRLLQLPPLPDIPEPLRGRAFVVVEAAYAGDEAAGAELMRPLRALAPEIDTLATIPLPALGKLHMDPEHPVPGAGDGMLLDELPEEALAALLAVCGAGTGSPLLSLELRHLGAALGHAPEGHGALGAFDAGFALFAVGIAMSPQLAAAVEERIDRVHEAMAPWAAGRYLNFSERHAEPAAFFGAEGAARLRRVKAAYDPQERILANHPIRPAE